VSVKSHICLACPRSCSIRPQLEGLPGQKLCPQGQEFLQQEIAAPLRHFFSTLRDNDGRLYAYRTVEPIELSEINAMHQKLKGAPTPEARNQIHNDFCQSHNTTKVCIDIE